MNIVKDWRRSRGYTQARAASLIGIHPNTLIKIEKKRPVGIRAAYKVARYFKISIWEMLPRPYQRRRIERGMSLLDVALELGVDEHTVARWEQGAERYHPKKRDKWLKMFE